MRVGASDAQRQLPNRPAVLRTQFHCHELLACGSLGQYQSSQTRQSQRVAYFRKIQGSTPRDMLRVLACRLHRRAAALDSTPLLGVKRYRDIGPGMLTTSRPDPRSTHHPVAGAKHGGRCFRAILRGAAEWRKRSDSSSLFPAALRAVVPIPAAQAFGSALSLGDAVGRRPPQSSRRSTRRKNMFALYVSLVLCWPRTIDN